MFLVLLKFSENKGMAGRWMARHNDWLKSGFDEGVFLIAGTLEPKAGGAILVCDSSRSDVEARLSADPFVAEGVVNAEILELTPSKADPRLAFLLP